MSAEPTTVVIADDHAPTRAGVCGALSADGFEIVAEGSSARQAVHQTLPYPSAPSTSACIRTCQPRHS